MMSPRRDRNRRPGRRPPFRDPKPVILIVCEGTTEREYLDGFWHATRNPRVTIRISPETGDPKTLVEVAKQIRQDAEDEAHRERDDNRAYDSVWCVCDVDDHSRLANARQMACDNGIKMAISNPCFELWLLLHFRDSPGMQHRDKVKQMLAKYVPEYDKHVEYRTYSMGYAEAVTRAKRLDRSAESDGDAGRNPTTDVYELTELICDEPPLRSQE